MSADETPEAVAIVGMAGRFPGASTPEALFENLCRGLDGVRREADFPRVDKTPAPPRAPFAGRAAGVLEGIDRFDAAYFGLTPREADVMDPQQRLFLECCAEALQRAGCDAGERARVGVYAGMGVNTYFLERVHPDARIMDGVGAFQAVASNEKDFVATNVAYRLDLTGPAMTVQTACSTSLVATVLAVESLLAHQCDVALAGGSAVKVDPAYGSFLEEGGIAAHDGRCRAFDAHASGTVNSSAVGVVVLKRLSDALRDGDHVHAVIRGAAVNNDGARKVGFAAPSVEGQASVIAEAQALAGVSPDDVGFVEAHGTGTQLGDPIEVAALTKAFRASTQRRAFCALGSVKSNLGHADAAAGVLGLIKAALVVEHGRIPPTIHFETPNPALKLDESPFYVNRETVEWRAERRVAGVSSFGIGGTNAHVVLERAAPRAPDAPDARPQLLVLSARTPAALEASAARLREHLERRPEAPLRDLAWTLQSGRRRFSHRLALAARDRTDALAALRGERRGVLTSASDPTQLRVAFLFPGQGAQHVGMARDLYDSEPSFRADVDRACELLRAHLGLDLRDVLYPTPERRDEAARRLATTALTQPALFVVEHALARLWIRWGIRPVALLGHSLGEYVAACLAGVMTLEDALALVALRGRLMEEMAPGAMLALPLAEDALRALLPPGLEIAAVNAPGGCVVSGEAGAVEAFDRDLRARSVDAKRLPVQRAFHSVLMEPALARFEAAVALVPLREPTIPIVSNLTGRPLDAREATSPAYWGRHLRHAVRFADGVAHLLADPGVALLEVGPGRTLSSLAARQLARPGERTIVPSLRHAEDATSTDALALREAVGRLWLAGARPDWSALHAPARPRKTIAPTYPFERRRHWLEPPQRAAVAPEETPVRMASWRRSRGAAPREAHGQRILVVEDEGARFAEPLVHRLRAAGADARRAPVTRDRLDADALVARLRSEAWRPTRIVHLGALRPGAADDSFVSLVALLQALDDGGEPPAATLATRGAFDVSGEDPVDAAAAAVAAAAAALPGAACGVVDLSARPLDLDVETALLAAEALAAPAVAALRGRRRWAPADEPVPEAVGTLGAADAVGAIGAGAAAFASAFRREAPDVAVLTRDGSDAPAAGAIVHEARGLALRAVVVAPARAGERLPLAKLDARAILTAAREDAALVESVRRTIPTNADSRLVVAIAGDGPAAHARAAAVAAACPDALVLRGEWALAPRGALRRALDAPPGVAMLDAPGAANADDPADAAATPAPEAHARPALGVAYVAPRTPLEDALVAIWEEALGFRGVGVEDDFFDLGGHSLLATRIVGRVRETFDVESPLPRFFEARTVAAFSRILEEDLLAKLEALSEEEALRALKSSGG